MKKIIFLIFFVIIGKVSSQYTQIPDPNFEQALIDLNVDNVLDGQVLTASIDTLTYLNLTNKNINDLTGIQDFIQLEGIAADWNHLTEVHISNLDSLIEAYFENNDITTLSITNCPSLGVLSFHDNNIDSLNLQGDNNIVYLYAFNNQLTALDVTGMTFLIDLIAFNNQIEQINLSDNYQLENLLMHDNNLSEIDMSNNHYLWQVTLANNPNLSGILNLSQTFNYLYSVHVDNTNLEVLNVKNYSNDAILIVTADNCSHLSCIITHNLNSPNIDNWVYPANTNIVDNINDCNSAIEINSAGKISLFPTPADKKIFFIADIIHFQTAKIFDLSGKLIKTIDINMNNYINVEDLPGGFYLLKLQNEEMEITQKIIVKH